MKLFYKPPPDAELQAPKIVHQHVHEPGRAGEYVTKFIFWIAVVLLVWPVGKFLFFKAGFRNPDQAWASVLIWAPAIFIGLLFISRRLEGLFDRWLTHRELMEDKLTEQLQIESRMQKSMVIDTRQTGDQARLSALVIAIMEKAYAHLAEKGQYKGNEKLPWSRREAGAETLYSLGEKEPVGEAMAIKAAHWLADRRVIAGRQIRVGEYPNLASIQRALYAPPVVLPPTVSSPVKHIKS